MTCLGHKANYASGAEMLQSSDDRRLSRRAHSGFTLVETLLALMILVILTGIVAMGVPVAWKTYTSTVNGSNAQTLLATASTVLRDELGTAQDVYVANDGSLYYVNGEGVTARLYTDGSNKDARIKKQVYQGTLDTSETNPTGGLTEDGSAQSILSEATMTKELGLAYTSWSYDGVKHVVTVTDLKVLDGDGNTLATTGGAASGNLFKIPVAALEVGR